MKNKVHNNTWPRNLNKLGSVVESVDEFSPGDFEGSLSALKRKVEDLIAEYGPDAKLDYDAHHFYPYDEYPSPRYFLTKNRPETQEEMDERLAQNAIDEETQRQRDLEQLAALQKRLGVK